MHPKEKEKEKKEKALKRVAPYASILRGKEAKNNLAILEVLSLEKLTTWGVAKAILRRRYEEEKGLPPPEDYPPWDETKRVDSVTWRRIQSLESLGYVERVVSGDSNAKPELKASFKGALLATYVTPHLRHSLDTVFKLCLEDCVFEDPMIDQKENDELDDVVSRVKPLFLSKESGRRVLENFVDNLPEALRVEAVNLEQIGSPELGRILTEFHLEMIRRTPHFQSNQDEKSQRMLNGDKLGIGAFIQELDRESKVNVLRGYATAVKVVGSRYEKIAKKYQAEYEAANQGIKKLAKNN
jgi:hypothetical protein